MVKPLETLSKNPVPMVGASPKNSATVSVLQLANAEFPTLVMLAGIVTLVRPEQLENAELPMLGPGFR